MGSCGTPLHGFTDSPQLLKVYSNIGVGTGGGGGGGAPGARAPPPPNQMEVGALPPLIARPVSAVLWFIII